MQGEMTRDELMRAASRQAATPGRVFGVGGNGPVVVFGDGWISPSYAHCAFGPHDLPKVAIRAMDKYGVRQVGDHWPIRLEEYEPDMEVAFTALEPVADNGSIFLTVEGLRVRAAPVLYVHRYIASDPVLDFRLPATGKWRERGGRLAGARDGDGNVVAYMTAMPGS